MGLSVASTISPPALAARLGWLALSIDVVQGDGGGIGTGLASIISDKSYIKAVDIGYGIFQVVK